MDIVIVAQYLSDLEHLEMTNGRFIYLAQMLKEKKENNVEIITTTFLHGKKKQAKSIPKEFMGCKITALYEPGYPKNVSLTRLHSHNKLANNIKKYLEGRKTPNVIYAAVPSLAVAETAANYCKKKGVRFIVDIQDLWPEAFKMVFNLPVISNLIFEPMRRQADRIYAAADDIVAVSQTYADRGLKINKKCKKVEVVYLGTEKKTFDSWAKKQKKDLQYIKIAYIGTLGYSYDISVVISAMKKLSIEELNKIKFIVMGDGPRRKRFEEEAEGLPVYFTGNLPYGEMIKVLTRCDIAVNPIVHGAAQSIINKHMDYAMAGLPVINTQECLEYRNLIDKFQCGINCECESEDDVLKAIRTLASNGNMQKDMGENHRKMAENLFDRKHSYEKIMKIIDRV